MKSIAQKAVVYLIPCPLSEGELATIPTYVHEAVKQCEVFFVENERSARRFLKSIWREMIIENYEWHTIHKAENDILINFSNSVAKGKIIGILSEAGCPGVADPGQILVKKAHQLKAIVKPLTGPSSILLALMASGLNGQQFRFTGYLPIDSTNRKTALQKLEEMALKTMETQIFIETPYRNDQLLADILKVCKAQTKLCIAANITAPDETIATCTIQEWKNNMPLLGKKPVIFLLGV